MASHLVLWSLLMLAAGTFYFYFLRRSQVQIADFESPKKLQLWGPLLGIDFLVKTLWALRRHKLLETFSAVYEGLNAHTYTVVPFNKRLILTIEPENVKTILSTNFQDYNFGDLREPAIPLLGKGIFASDGAEWQHSRNLLRPIFARSQFADLNILKPHVDQLLARLPRDGSTVNLQPLFFCLTLDVASEFLLGQSTHTLSLSGGEPGALQFAKAFDRATAYLDSGDGWGIIGFYLKKSQFKRDCKCVHDFVDPFIQKALAETQSDTALSHNVFLQELISQKEHAARIRTEILNVLFAGRDTTAAFLSDIWFQLSRHPSVVARLQAEIETMDPDQALTFETLKSLPYLRAILNECLRLHPVVPANIRAAKCDTYLPLGAGDDQQSPVFVPAGTLVSWNIYGMHRRKDLYGEDADLYRPERWLDEGDQKGVRPGWGFLPFNGGPRICIGQQFALFEASYVTVRLMRAISGIECRDPEPWRESLNVVLTPLNGCRVGLHFK